MTDQEVVQKLVQVRLTEGRSDPPWRRKRSVESFDWFRPMGVGAEDSARARFAVPDVRADDDAVGAIQVGDIVGLEVLRVGLRVEAPQPVTAAGALEVALQRPAAERGQRGVERRVGPIRPLRIVRARALDTGDRLRGARDERAAEHRPELVLTALEAHQRVASGGECIPRQQAGQRIAVRQIAVHGVDEEAVGRAERAKLLPDPPEAVVGPRRDAHLRGAGHGEASDTGVLFARHRRLHADRRLRPQTARDLGRAENRRILRVVHEIARGGAGRPRANSARVVEVGMVDAEELRSLEEERPLLGEPCRERRQVHFGGIGLDLAKVRVEGGFERQVRPQPELHIRAHPARQIPAIVERVGQVAGAIDGGAACYIGKQLDAPRRPDAFDATQVAEARDKNAFGAGHHHPVALLTE